MTRRVLSIAAGVSLGVAASLRSTVRAPVLDPEVDGAVGLLTSLPSLSAALAYVALGAIVGYLVRASSLGRKLAPFLLMSLAAGVLVPGLFSVAPFLSLFSGRLLDFVIVGAALSMATAHVLDAPWRVAFEPRRRHVSLAAFVLFLVVGLKLSHDVGLSGDEPHYLLITHSILEDGDLRVQNNYANEDHQRFYRGKIGPHLALGTEYSIHGVGLPVLLTPGYAALGLTGVVGTLALLSAILVGAVFETAVAVTHNRLFGLVAALLFAVTSPGLFLSVSAYPELPAAFIMALVTGRLLGPARTSAWSALGWSVLVGSLPLFHMKFVPLMLVLWGALFYRLSARRASLIGAGASVAVSVLYFYVTTGSVNPTASYGRQRVFLSSIPEGLAGLLFDQEFGLLMAAPFYLIGIAGLVALARKHPFLGLVSVLALAAVALPGAAHPLWSGGNSPPARFLFPLLPLLAVAAVTAWQSESEHGMTPWFPVLAVWSVCVSVFTLALPGQPLYLNQRDGTGRLWEVLSDGWDLTSYLPSVVTGDTRSMLWIGVAAVTVLGALGLQWRRRSVWLPPVPVVVLLCLWVQDLTGVVPSRGLEGRWASAWMREAAANGGRAAVALPAFEPLLMSDSVARISLPLDLRPAADGRYWSRAYSIPAGRYRLNGPPLVSAPCNDAMCFPLPEGADGFETGVGWARFQLRAHDKGSTARLRLEHGSPAPIALKSLSLPTGGRLHGLDDNAYLDRRGYWVKSERRARFVLEGEQRLVIRNGGVANAVTIQSIEGDERWEMAPGDEREVPLPLTSGAIAFSVESATGFQPSAVDPGSDDRRNLGVFLTAPRF